MSDITKTPKEELECKKKYLYECSMFWECNDGSKCQILEDDVVDLLNELSDENRQLKEENEFLKMENEEHKALIEKRWGEYMQKKFKENEE